MERNEESTKNVGTRVRVFVDFWNFSISMKDQARRAGMLRPPPLDWKRIGAWLAAPAQETLRIARASCAGVHVYASHNPSSRKDDGVRAFLHGIAKIDGMSVKLLPRALKRAPRCTTCFEEVDHCPEPACGASMCGTVEKGVDTTIVTDTLRLGWDGAWDVAVLLSADADFIPAVDVLRAQGLPVIQAGIPPYGAFLARACAGAMDVSSALEELRR